MPRTDGAKNGRDRTRDRIRDEFCEQVVAYIRTHDLLPAGSRIVAGVSGGPDSLALLLLLEKLRRPLSLQLAAAHINHGLRGSAADEDEAFVRSWCEKLDVPCFVRRVNLPILAAGWGIGLEEAGRRVRYAFFDEIAPQARIALAHHLDDQAETILLHLGRGSGLDGLVGMKPASGRVVRPLLSQSRQSIENWLAGQKITWRQDESNADLFALRNRLRICVLPAWQQALGYDPAPLLNRTAGLLAEDQQLLDELARQAADRIRRGESLELDALQSLPQALLSRVLRMFWSERSGSNCNLTADHIRQLKGLLQSGRQHWQLCLPGSWRAEADGRNLSVRKYLPAESRPEIAISRFLPAESRPEIAIPLELPGMTPIPQLDLQIAAVLIENESQIVYNSAMEYFRLDMIQGSQVRLRQPGDRIHPFGRRGGKLLKKFLNEQRIQLQDRAKLPLIALGREVVWLPGYAAGAGFAGRPGDGQPGKLVRLELQELMPVDCNPGCG